MPSPTGENRRVSSNSYLEIGIVDEIAHIEPWHTDGEATRGVFCEPVFVSCAAQLQIRDVDLLVDRSASTPNEPARSPFTRVASIP